jgi:hypothetical protein
MITINSQHEKTQKTLQLSLYSGIALIIISMLFLGRSLESSSFIVQAITVLAAPAFFYVVGAVVYRYLSAPLAAPGIVATGAWLIGVGLIHLNDKRGLMPDILQPYYWLVASALAAILITLTGHRVRIWMLVPLVPLAQVNAIWAVMGVVGLNIAWLPPLSFVLVLLWLEFPIKDERWKSIYHTSGILLASFLLVLSMWLPVPTAQTMMTTWGAAAGLAALLGIKHGWIKLGPLAIVLLVCASIWGLPATWWPPVWFALAAATVLLIERIGARKDIEKEESAEKGKDSKGGKSIEISEALAVLLCGASALLAQVGPLVGMPMLPLGTTAVLVGTGALLAWLGWRRDLRAAAHAGLWLIASAWGSVYFVAAPASGTYGLWLSLFATSALLAERLLASGRKEKHKSSHTITETITYWPMADLVLGLSIIILLWTAIYISVASAWVLAVTFSVVVGLWIAAGLMYRLPILLHAALWIAPLPFALVMILLDPAIWTLPLMGVAWQGLGACLLIFGHIARYRPAILAPFFIVGYALAGFGLTLTLSSPLLQPLSLLIVVLICVATSAAVITDHHPVWSLFVARFISPEKRPYAYNSVHHTFLLLAAWLPVVWLHVMFSYTGLSLARQGMGMVGLACAWFVLGRLLSRLPGVVSWPVIGAGWLMWLVGLLEVFYSPTEALLTMILGLVVSGEALRRTKEAYWIPVFVVQVFFAALQLTLLMTLPTRTVLLVVAGAVCVAGMAYEQYAQKAGRIAAVTGGLLAAGIALLRLDAEALVGLGTLAVLATVNYRRWEWLSVVYFCAALVFWRSGVKFEWSTLLILGIAQWLIGAELVRLVRPRKFRTLKRALAVEADWATPFLWVGTLCVGAGFILALQKSTDELLVVTRLVAAVLAALTIRLRITRLPYATLLVVGAGIALTALRQLQFSYSTFGDSILYLSIGMALAAMLIRWLCIRLVRQPALLARTRWFVWWIRPLIITADLLSGISLILLMVIGNFYQVGPLLKIGNGLLLASYAMLVYTQQRRLILLWPAIGITSYTWLIVLSTLELNSTFWQVLLPGLLLIILAQIKDNPQHTAMEGTGVVVLLIGAAAGVNRAELISAASLPLALGVIGLLVYGYIAGRHIPFATGLFFIAGSVIYLIAKINVWLIPLAGGLVLMLGTLAIEVRRENVERFITAWAARWKAWR